MDDKQLKQMEADRQKMMERLNAITDKEKQWFEYSELIQSIKAHDLEVGKMLGITTAVLMRDCYGRRVH